VLDSRSGTMQVRTCVSVCLCVCVCVCVCVCERERERERDRKRERAGDSREVQPTWVGFHMESIRGTTALKTRESQGIVPDENNAGTLGPIRKIVRDCSK
jgi:hypothetical protein